MLTILDTTLRDGAQHKQVSFSENDKRDIIRALDGLGLSYIEFGSPSFNEADAEIARTLPATKCAEPVAFGMTRKKGITAEEDDALKALLSFPVRTVVLVGKASAEQVKDVLRATLDENLDIISSSVSLATKNDKIAIFDAEHFFDGYKQNPGYSIECLHRAYVAGATVLTLCDTNGGTLPEDILSTVQAVKREFPKAVLGIHCHNDNGLAVAGTLAAVKGGATHVQGTLLGFGERCGNANLSTLLPLLAADGALTDINLKMLTPVCRTVAEIANVRIPDSYPYVGRGAFAHKAGLHADGVLKSNRSFEHIDPETVGNDRELLLSKEAGRHLVAAKLKAFFPNLDPNSQNMKEILRILKSKENDGYTYEAAEASFVLTAGEILKRSGVDFEPVGYAVTNTSDEPECSASTTVKVGGSLKTAAAKGLGPVHALDKAMRACMLSFFPALQNITLIDYKVRVLNPKSATGAKVRVLISTTDGHSIWKTIGVSEDIIRASFIALVDSYKFGLNYAKCL